MILAGSKNRGCRTPGLLLTAATCLVLFATGCTKDNNHLETLTFSGETMGSTYTIKAVYSEGLTPVLKKTLPGTIKKKIDYLDTGTFSTYNQKSELSELNRAPVGRRFQISPAMNHVVKMAWEISEISIGAFDATVGPAVNLWGFGPDKVNTIPSPEAVSAAMSNIGFQYLILDDKVVTKTKAISVDLSAIAKGYAVDQIGGLLKKSEAKGYMVEIGGEIRTHGSREDGTKWRIAIEEPNKGKRSVRHVLELNDASVATSGDYRNFKEGDGSSYTHTIDPRTGRPVTHKLASVTVVHVNTAAADAWATAIMVLGPVDGLALAEEYYLPVLLMVREGSAVNEIASSKFKEQFPVILKDS